MRVGWIKFSNVADIDKLIPFGFSEFKLPKNVKYPDLATDYFKVYKRLLKHKLFDNIKEGDLIPTYNIILERDVDGFHCLKRIEKESDEE